LFLPFLSLTYQRAAKFSSHFFCSRYFTLKKKTKKQKKKQKRKKGIFVITTRAKDDLIIFHTNVVKRGWEIGNMCATLIMKNQEESKRVYKVREGEGRLIMKGNVMLN
jgi:hypothetical protein